MRNVGRWLFVGVVAVFGTGRLRAEKNLVTNPGFERLDSKGWADDWSPRPGVFTVEKEGARNGECCLRFENHDAEKYVLCSIPLDLEPGKQFEFEAYVKTKEIQGKDTGATVCVQWWGQEGAFLGGSYPSGVKGTQREWQLIRGRTRPIPTEAKRFDLTCYVRKKMTGVAWWDDVKVTRYHPPVAHGMVTDRYRDMTDGGWVNVEVGLNLADREISPRSADVLLQVLRGQGIAVMQMEPLRLTPEKASFQLNSSPLSPGKYELLCRVRDEEGEILGEERGRLQRVEAFPERKAYIDEHRRLILDGKPFFPLGTYWGGISEDHLDLYEDSSFNCLMPYHPVNREALDAAHKRGVKVIYSVKDYYAGRCGLKNEDEARVRIEEVVGSLRDHPAIMAWYINDELPLSLLDDLRAHQSWMEELDPGRPTWVVLYQVGEVREYLPTFDVIGTDPYPIPHKPVSMAFEYAQMTHEAVFGCRALWMVPQIFNWASYKKDPEEKKRYRPPTLEEIRSMAWQCIAGGANGLIFYSWSDLWRMDREMVQGGRALVREPFEARWREVKEVGREIACLFPVLLSVDPVVEPTHIEAPEGVHCRLYGHQGNTYLLLVNSEQESVGARMSFSKPPKAVELLLGKKKPSVDGVQLCADFEPLEAKMVSVQF